MRLEIVVDELVVSGLPPNEARLAAAALEHRLAALAAESTATLSERSEPVRRVTAGDARGASPAAVGEAAAGAVWRELAGGAR